MFGDLELAKFVERMAGVDDAAYVHAMKGLFPQKTFATHEFNGGTSCYAGNSPFSNTHGFGTDSKIHDLDLLREIESFFGKFGCPPILSVASVCDAGPLRMLFDTGYCPLGYRNVYLHGLGEIDAGNIPEPRISIHEVCSKEDLSIWLKVVSDGFAGKPLSEPDPISIGQSAKEGNRFFIAKFDDQVAAGAATYINGEFARLGGMATLPDFRGRGVQQALIRFRLRIAMDGACRFIVSDTNPGNDSQRNLERLGFKLAYIRGIYRKQSNPVEKLKNHGQQ